MMQDGELPETPQMRRGRILEPAAVRFLREERPDWKIEYSTESMIYYRDVDARIGGTPDVVAKCPKRGRGVVQIKSVQKDAFLRKWFDERGKYSAPIWIQVQAAVERYLTGAAWAAVMPFVVDHGLRGPLIDIEVVPGMMDTVKERVAEFWKRVEIGDRPANFGGDGEVLKRLYPAETKGLFTCLTDITEADVARYHELGEKIREATAARNAIINRAKYEMGFSEYGSLGDGRRVICRKVEREETITPPRSYRQIKFPAALPEFKNPKQEKFRWLKTAWPWRRR